MKNKTSLWSQIISVIRFGKKPKHPRANPAFNALVIEASRAGLILTRPTNRTYLLVDGNMTPGTLNRYNQKFTNMDLVRDAVNARASALKAEGQALATSHKICHQSCQDDPRC